MKSKQDEQADVVVLKTLAGMLVLTLLMVSVTTGYVAVFHDRDNGLLVFVRYVGIAFAVLLGLIVTIRGHLLQHIARNW